MKIISDKLMKKLLENSCISLEPGGIPFEFVEASHVQKDEI